MRGLIFIFALMVPAGQRSPADPLEHLPPRIEILTHFGERADISPDNQRVAFMGETADGPLRLTFDRNIRGVFTAHWCLAGFDGGLPVLSDGVICEFKYRAFLPALFKEIVQAMRLTPTPVSKYRAFLRASGRVGERSAADAGVA